MDNFNLSANFELKISEIQSLVRIHATALLPRLIEMLSDPIYSDSTNLFELFLLTAFSVNLTSELVDFFLSDSTLSLIDSWLASSDSLKEITVLLLLCRLISTIQNPVHIAKLQVLSLKHLNIFLRSEKSLFFSLIKLALFDDGDTPKFIYKLHQKLITMLYYPFTTSIVYGSLTSLIEGIDRSSIEHYIAKKAGFMLILLKNYRNDFLKLIIETLDFAPREVEEIILAFPEISESRYVQIGNPKFCEQPTIPNHPKELNKRMLDFFQSST
ncbi:MAG: hypothetical protein ACP5NS_03225 [Candidatus Pacearchaeota archaeon]